MLRPPTSKILARVERSRVYCAEQTHSIGASALHSITLCPSDAKFVRKRDDLTIIHGLCSHQAISLVEMYTKPFELGLSPRIDFSRVDFPDATGPIRSVSLDIGMVRLMSCKIGSLVIAVQLKAQSRMLIASLLATFWMPESSGR